MNQEHEGMAPREAQLRAQVEARLPPAPQTGGAIEELLHELQVHKLELEMQNEELRRAQLALEESRDRYMELYEFAPVGYLTLSGEALISEVNLTGAMLLGEDRKKMLQRRFSRYVAPEDRDRYHRLFVGVMQHDDRQSFELA